MTTIDPTASRAVEPSPQHPGMMQLAVAGRTFQINAVGPEAAALLEQHAEAVINGTPGPDFGRRWPVREDPDA